MHFKNRLLLELNMESNTLYQMDRGVIFDIQKYAIHDGPGIRTLVFLKGCPLDCAWCQNPEGKKVASELLYIRKKCVGCGSCVEVCGANVLSLVEGTLKIDREQCILCGKCVATCPCGALRIAGKNVAISDLLEEIEKDRAFYENTDGGVTLSGGEPTFQSGFIISLAKALKKIGINTSVETCGYVKWPVFKAILDNVDLVLYDVKLINSQKHRKYTGKKNDLILANLVKLSKIGSPYRIRIPVIPTINNLESDIFDFLDFFKQLDTLPDRIDLLAYNPLCIEKYENLALTYELCQLSIPNKEQLKHMAKMFEKNGFEVNIGGA